MPTWWIVEDVDRTDPSKSTRDRMNLTIIQNKVVHTHTPTCTYTHARTHYAILSFMSLIDLHRKVYSVALS
jgi:hypothetical protein